MLPAFSERKVDELRIGCRISGADRKDRQHKKQGKAQHLHKGRGTSKSSVCAGAQHVLLEAVFLPVDFSPPQILDKQEKQPRQEGCGKQDIVLVKHLLGIES